MNIETLEHRVLIGSRYLTVIAVLGSLAGSLLMFVLGLINIIDAFRYGILAGGGAETAIPDESASVIAVIEGLDRFLIAIVLLYFAYGVYSLFIEPERPRRDISLPRWLRVKQIGQLKQVVAEVIIVILFVLFLRVALRVFEEPGVSLSWPEVVSFLLLPFATALLSLSLRLVELHPKPPFRIVEQALEADEEPVEP